MKKALPIVALCAAAILTTIFLNGCGGKEVAAEAAPVAAPSDVAAVEIVTQRGGREILGRTPIIS